MPESQDTLFLDLIGEIEGRYNFDMVQFQLDGFRGDKIVTPIHSLGGSIVFGMPIYHLLNGHRAEVETRVLYAAMSMGSVIALAGDKRVMPKNGLFMVHKPNGQASGEASDLRESADLMDKMEGQIIDIYKEKTKLSLPKIKDLVKSTTYLDGKEAKKLGFITHLSEKIDIQAAAPFLFHKNNGAIPELILNQIDLIKPNNNQIENKTSNSPVATDNPSVENEEETVVEESASTTNSNQNQMKDFISKLKNDFKDMFGDEFKVEGEEPKAEDFKNQFDAFKAEALVEAKAAAETAVAAAFKNQLETLNASIAASELKFTNLQDQFNTYKAESEGFKTKVTALETAATAATAKFDELKAECDGYKNQIETLTTEKTDLETKVAKYASGELVAQGSGNTAFNKHVEEIKSSAKSFKVTGEIETK